MRLPVWIRRLPHNLSTIRPAVRLYFSKYCWRIGVKVYFDAHEGDEDYLFYFDETGFILSFGPLELFIGLIDTPEENAWLP